MTSTLTAHLGELAEALHDLRRRFRHAARVEVARAVGEALREATLAMICGPARYQSTARTRYSAWDDDPWQDRGDDPWHSRGTHAQEVEVDDAEANSSMLLPPALMAGLGAARWGFARTQQIGPAILIGFLVALAAYSGGPTIKALLEAWSAANDLLSYPSQVRRP